MRSAQADDAQVQAKPATQSTRIKFTFPDAELRQVIDTYAKASGHTFVIDPGVRGKASILPPDDVTLDEALNLLSTALEVNGFSISKRGDVWVVMSSRNIQRTTLPIYTEAPPIAPVEMATLIFTPKYAEASELNKRLRVLPSKDGEMTPYEPTNQLVITDYTPNLARIAKMVALLDRPETKEFKAEQADRAKHRYDHNYYPQAESHDGQRGMHNGPAQGGAAAPPSSSTPASH